MTAYYIQPLDPQEIAARFSQGDGLEPLPETDEQWKNLHLDKIKAVLDRLPAREADLVRLYFFRGKRQTDIAEIFSVTQAAVSYRLQRALMRIRFLIEIPEVTKEQIFTDLHGLMEELDARIFSEMFLSTCQSEVAKILDISQGRVRHRYIANLAKLGDHLYERLLEWDYSLSDAQLGPEAVRVCEMIEDYDDLKKEGALPEVNAPEDDLLFWVVNAMREVDDDEVLPPDLLLLGDYYKTFLTIRYHFNILREIRSPKWTSRPKHSLV